MNRDETIILKDENGKNLRYDGTGNCALFHEQFDDGMIAKGYAGIVSPDNYEMPLEPEDALRNIANEVATHHDFSAAGGFQKAMSHYRNRGGVVHSVYKYHMSVDIRAFLKQADRVQFSEATKANYHGMKARVIAEYGSWDETKAKKNLLSAMIIPQILDVSSADHAFARLDELTQERLGWARVAENFTAEFFRVWLKDRIKTWPRLKQIHERMELDEDITYVTGKRDVMKLVNIDRHHKSMHVSVQDQVAAISNDLVKPTVAPTLPTDTTSFQYEVNQASYDGFQRGYEAAAATSSQYAPHGRQYAQRDLSKVRCYKCDRYGHMVDTCPERERERPQRDGHYVPPPRIQQDQRFQQWKQQGGASPSILGKRQQEGGAQWVPSPAKRVAFRETYPMTGPGQLQGSAGIEQYDPVDYAAFQQRESLQFQADQVQRYEAHCARTFPGEYTTNTVRSAYEEPVYQLPKEDGRDQV